MSLIAVKAQRDFLTSLANVRPVLAVSELIWNGFDASCSKVKVSIDMNGLDTMEAIRVSDDGHGILHDDVELLFGNLGASWKLRKTKQNGRILHGKSGKGRFRAFGLGSHVTWNTVFEKDGRFFKYDITGSRDALDSFSVSDPVEVHGVATGTEVCIENLDQAGGCYYNYAC
ncbi:MAG: ATP-binding protein, partial [Bacteroidota bacterium]